MNRITIDFNDKKIRRALLDAKEFLRSYKGKNKYIIMEINFKRKTGIFRGRVTILKYIKMLERMMEHENSR